jgi:hypothetical protein
MFTYNQTINAYDEYCRIDESMSFASLKSFVKVVMEVFQPEFL